MPKNLVIVESPAKSKTISKYLGKDFDVMASYGHVRDLVPKEGAVDPDNDFTMTRRKRVAVSFPLSSNLEVLGRSTLLSKIRNKLLLILLRIARVMNHPMTVSAYKQQIIDSVCSPTSEL